MPSPYLHQIRNQPLEALSQLQANIAKIEENSAELYRLARLLLEFGMLDESLLVWRRLIRNPDTHFFAAYQISRRRYGQTRSLSQALEALNEFGGTKFSGVIANLLATDGVPVNQNAMHIAICGVSFSGSTLLDRIVNGLGGVASIGESHWLTKSYDGVRAGPLDFNNPLTSEVPQCSVCGAKCEVLTPTFRAQLAGDPRDWYFKLAARLGGSIIVSADKNLAKIVLNDPQLRMHAIVLYKSPQQAWASQVTKLASGKDAGFYYEQMQSYMKTWKTTYQDLLSEFRPSGYKMFLNFDHFTLNPRLHLESIADIFGIPFDERVLTKAIPGHSIGGNAAAMQRLRKSGYEVRVNPVTAPSIPAEHANWISSNPEINDLYHALDYESVRCLGRGAHDRISRRETTELATRSPIRFRVHPFSIETIPEERKLGVFGDFKERALAAAAALENQTRPASKFKHKFFNYLAEKFDADAYALIQQRHLVKDQIPPKSNELKYLDTVHWIEGKIDHALELRLHALQSLKILDLGTGPGHFQVVCEFFGHRTLGLDIPLQSRLPSAERHLYDDLCHFFGVKKQNYKIVARQPLPDIGQRFDLVTSFMAWFNSHPNGAAWSPEDWTFFLRDLRDRLLTPGGRIYLNLVKEAISEETWSFLAARATKATERNRTLLFESVEGL